MMGVLWAIVGVVAVWTAVAIVGITVAIRSSPAGCEPHKERP